MMQHSGRARILGGFVEWVVGIAFSPIGVIAASIGYLRFAPAPDFAHELSPTVSLLWASTQIIAASACVAALVALSRPKLVSWWINSSLSGRVMNFVDLMSLAERSVVLVTGSLHHNLYAQDEVVCALESLAADIRIVVYHEEEIDRASARFNDELVRRHARFVRIRPDTISHGAVVDAKHTKIEAFGVDDAAPDKHVDYFPFDAKRARSAIAEIEAAVLEPEALAA